MGAGYDDFELKVRAGKYRLICVPIDPLIPHHASARVHHQPCRSELGHCAQLW